MDYSDHPVLPGGNHEVCVVLAREGYKGETLDGVDPRLWTTGPLYTLVGMSADTPIAETFPVMIRKMLI